MSAEPIDIAPLGWRASVSTVLVESVDAIRLGLHLLLTSDRQRPHTVHAAVSTAIAGLAAVRDYRPDLLVTCVELADMPFPQFLRAAKQACPALTVLVTTEEPSEEEQFGVLRLDAQGYIAKTASADDLRVAFAAAADRLVRMQVPGRRLRRLYAPGASGGYLAAAEEPEPDYRPLSNRELQVMQCLAEGMSNKLIAARLGISDQTVKNHVTHILRVTKAGGRTGVAVYGLRRGWVSATPPGWPQ